MYLHEILILPSGTCLNWETLLPLQSDIERGHPAAWPKKLHIHSKQTGRLSFSTEFKKTVGKLTLTKAAALFVCSVHVCQPLVYFSSSPQVRNEDTSLSQGDLRSVSTGRAGRVKILQQCGCTGDRQWPTTTPERFGMRSCEAYTEDLNCFGCSCGKNQPIQQLNLT